MFRHYTHTFHRVHHSEALLPITIIMLCVVALTTLVWLAVRRPWDLWDITDAVSGEDLKRAKEAAKASRSPVLPKLTYTESKYRWVLLYDHARSGQIDPSILKRMRRSDLEYLAGMDYPHPDLAEPRLKGEFQDEAGLRHEGLTKLQGNVSRAKAELNRRNQWNATMFAALAVLAAGILGALLATS